MMASILAASFICLSVQGNTPEGTPALSNIRLPCSGAGISGHDERGRDPFYGKGQLDCMHLFFVFLHIGKDGDSVWYKEENRPAGERVTPYGGRS